MRIRLWCCCMHDAAIGPEGGAEVEEEVEEGEGGAMAEGKRLIGLIERW